MVDQAAMRAKIRLDPDGFQRAYHAVRAGESPDAAVQAAGSIRATTAAARLTPDEQVVFDQLTAAGKTADDALAAIQTQRDMIRRTGAMTPAQAGAEIAARVGNRSPKR